MTSLSLYSTALTLLGASAVHAVTLIEPQNINKYEFPDDLVNATTTVNFNAYNVTDSFSNSSEANTPWQVRLKVRSNVSPFEISPDASEEEKEKFDFRFAMSEISLTYNVDDDEDVEEPDDSWAYCAATQPLYNLTIPADQNVEPSCEGVIEQECIEWLQNYANEGGPCMAGRNYPEFMIHQDLQDSPCSNQTFPMPETSFRAKINDWNWMRNLTLEEMSIQYQSAQYDNPEDTSVYDSFATHVYVLLASWGEKAEIGDKGAIDNFRNGTVLCMRANETAEGTRTFEEIVEDDATVLGGRQVGAVTMAVAAASAAFLTFVI